MSDDDVCPGEGRCHGSRSWCDSCGDVGKVCDASRCDRHRCVECNEIRPPESRDQWCYVCDVCEPPEPIAILLRYRVAASVLVANLAVAGALCRSFDLGQRFEEPFPLGPRDLYPPWRPGDGRSVS